MEVIDLKKKYPNIKEDVRRWDCGWREAIARREKDKQTLDRWTQ